MSEEITIISGNIVFRPVEGEPDGGKYVVVSFGNRTRIATQDFAPDDLHKLADHLHALRTGRLKPEGSGE